jgi:hypothetical protein
MKTKQSIKKKYCKYRTVLKEIILKNSDDMHQRCLYCGKKVKPRDEIDCMQHVL